MFKVICVTNSGLCGEPILDRIRRLASAGADAIVLREKQLPLSEYRQLAIEANEICLRCGTELILNTFASVGDELGLKVVMPTSNMKGEKLIVSCHSVFDAINAKRGGACAVIAGHIFATECKKGMEGRGVGFLSEVVKSVDIPVYAIGGIDSFNIATVMATDASGACVMSGAMKCDDAEIYINSLKVAAKQKNNHQGGKEQKYE